MHCTALYCTVLHLTVLYHTVLHCNALYCTLLYLYLDTRRGVQKKSRIRETLNLSIDADNRTDTNTDTDTVCMHAFISPLVYYLGELFFEFLDSLGKSYSKEVVSGFEILARKWSKIAARKNVYFGLYFYYH